MGGPFCLLSAKPRRRRRQLTIAHQSQLYSWLYRKFPWLLVSRQSVLRNSPCLDSTHIRPRDATVRVAAAMAALASGCAQQLASPPPSDSAPQESTRPSASDRTAADPIRAPAPAVAADLPAAEYRIYFAFNRSDVDRSYDTQFDDIAQHVKERNDAWVVLRAHTDDRGSREYNIALAQRRADEVRRRLVRRGVPETRIKIIALGEERAGPNVDASRRVDIDYRYSPR